MTGPFIAHETLLCCPFCSSIFESETLLQMVPKWCNIGYDVLVYVGRALFQRYRTIQEVSSELYSRNVQISDSEISYLGYKFISNLAVCYQQAAPRIRQSMTLTGGYILHLDATHDGNAPALMTGIDSLSKIVLGNVKIPSEHADHIAPFLQKLQKGFGTPQACVHDMGKGICKAVAKAFLAGELPVDIDLLPLASVYSMISWILQGKHSGDGYGFPFDRPLLVFAERLLEVHQQLPRLLACCPDTDKIGQKAIIKLTRIVSDLIEDTLLQQELHWRC